MAGLWNGVASAGRLLKPRPGIDAEASGRQSWPAALQHATLPLQSDEVAVRLEPARPVHRQLLGRQPGPGAINLHPIAFALIKNDAPHSRGGTVVEPVHG